MAEKVVMVICEKPDAARRMAEALDDTHKPKKVFKKKSFFEASQPGQRIIICSAIGHLYGVDSKWPASTSVYPVWDYEWAPNYRRRGMGRQKALVEAISELADEADEFVNACDFDTEGSLIGFMVLKYACKNAHLKAKRMRFSTLVANELRGAYASPMPRLDFSIVEAGMCRHEVDWLYGINLSRALMGAVRAGGRRYATLSIGRVQGPTLSHIVDREAEIEAFVPAPYWEVNATVVINGVEMSAEYGQKRMKARLDAEEIVEGCLGKTGIIDEVRSSIDTLQPPYPFDLTSLQSESFRHFNISPRTTLDIAERLYLDALISYPRTSSQKLPEIIGYREVLNKIRRFKQYSSDASALLTKTMLKPHEGKKEDPAHPAIYPTGEESKRKLEAREEKVFDLVMKRFLATFGEPAKRRMDKVVINVNSHTFLVNGSKIIEHGWIPLYSPYVKFEEVLLPEINEGQKVFFKFLNIEEKFTQHPPRYNPSSLLRLMEKLGIGTKATRTDIIDTLYRRGYIHDRRIAATPLAFEVVNIFKKTCPSIIDVEFTRSLEEAVERIERGEEKRENVIRKAVSDLKPVMDELHRNEKDIGQRLSETIKRMRESEYNLRSPCPECGATLRIIKSRSSGKRFIGCTGYEHGCRFALPLPQSGKLTLLDRMCKKCGFQTIMINLGRRGKPMFSCPLCFKKWDDACSDDF